MLQQLTYPLGKCRDHRSIIAVCLADPPFVEGGHCILLEDCGDLLTANLEANAPQQFHKLCHMGAEFPLKNENDPCYYA